LCLARAVRIHHPELGSACSRRPDSVEHDPAAVWGPGRRQVTEVRRSQLLRWVGRRSVGVFHTDVEDRGSAAGPTTEGQPAAVRGPCRCPLLVVVVGQPLGCPRPIRADDVDLGRIRCERRGRWIIADVVGRVRDVLPFRRPVGVVVDLVWTVGEVPGLCLAREEVVDVRDEDIAVGGRGTGIGPGRSRVSGRRGMEGDVLAVRRPGGRAVPTRRRPTSCRAASRRSSSTASRSRSCSSSASTRRSSPGTFSAGSAGGSTSSSTRPIRSSCSRRSTRSPSFRSAASGRRWPRGGRPRRRAAALPGRAVPPPHGPTYVRRGWTRGALHAKPRRRPRTIGPRHPQPRAPFAGFQRSRARWRFGRRLP
jgi:hypothetical protein